MSVRTDDSVFANLQQVTGATYDDLTYNNDLMDVFILMKAREKGVRLDTGGPPEEYKYLGAWVDATAGMHYHDIYVDVSSMYPNGIITLNASPETIVGTKADLEASEYTEEDVVWGYIDPRDVKHLDKGESWQQYIDGEYKMVYDPHAPSVKWTCDERNGPQYEKLYFLDHDVKKGFLTETVEDLINLKNQYRGTSLYASTKRVTNSFTEDTKILTPDGAVPITEIEVGDTVYAFDTENYWYYETTVDEVFEYPEYRRGVYRFHNSSIDLEVTPHHEMVYVGVDGETHSTTARALAETLQSEVVTVPSVRGMETIRGSVLSSEDVDYYDTSHGVYCLQVEGDDHTVLAGRNGTFSPVHQSVYGITGYATEDSSFRLFDWRLAEAITLMGRKMIQFSRDYVLDYLHDNGYPDAYASHGDTDGVGISVEGASTRDRAMEVVGEAVEKLNEEGYDEFFEEQFGVDPSQHRGEIEIESYSPKVFIPSTDPPHGEDGVKKRRVEWITWDDDDGDDVDEIDITGLEAERSDIAPITRVAQEEFGETLRMDEGEGREYLFPKLREWAEAIQDGEMDLERVAKRKGIGQNLHEYGTQSRRPSPIYRGAKYANENIGDVTIQHGDKPVVIYIKDVRGDYPSVYDAVTAEDGDRVDAVALPTASILPEEFVVDWEKHWRKVLKESMEPLLGTRGWPWSDVQYDHRQSGLEAFE